MYIFNSDIDNTLIFSYKHDIGPQKVNIELYKNREISFVTEYTYNLLSTVIEKTFFVPATTRSIEQYSRIDWGVRAPEYALVCNGGVLLRKGIEDESWYSRSLEIAAPAEAELNKAWYFLEGEPRRNFELRFIKNLFIFTKCIDSIKVIEELKKLLDNSIVDIFNNNEKVYVIPKGLNKGSALLRFRDLYKKTLKIIAAGDSEFDISMSRVCDIFLAPCGSQAIFGNFENIVFMPGAGVFSDELLDYVIKIVE